MTKAGKKNVTTGEHITLKQYERALELELSRILNLDFRKRKCNDQN